MAVGDLSRSQIRTSRRVPFAGWAVTSGAVGVAANILLLLFYITARPWQDEPGTSGWYGTANDYLVAVQYAALIPVAYGLGRLLAGDRRARVWTRVALTASAAIAVLQILLLTGVLDFAVQGPLVGACAVLTLGWVGVASGAAERSRALPWWLTRFGRLIGVGVPVAVVAFVLGGLVSWLADVPWAWAAGGLPGFVLWFLFPVWILLLAGARTGAEDASPAG